MKKIREFALAGIVVLIVIALALTALPPFAAVAQAQEWYEGNTDQQTSFLFDYFKKGLQDGAYSAGQYYSKSNNLYRAWRAADTEGKIEAAPPKARSFAAGMFLRLKRNEIFARNGDDFEDAALEVFFTSMGWYKKVPNFQSENLTEAELANIKEIKSLEKRYKNDYEAAFYTFTPIQVKLSDGSSLKGSVRLRYFSFDSDYGKLKVPVNEVTEIRPKSDGMFVVYLKSGDRITGNSPNIKIPILTLFGQVDLEIASASQIMIVQ